MNQVNSEEFTDIILTHPISSYLRKTQKTKFLFERIPLSKIEYSHYYVYFQFFGNMFSIAVSNLEINKDESVRLFSNFLDFILDDYSYEVFSKIEDGSFMFLMKTDRGYIFYGKGSLFLMKEIFCDII